MKKNNRLDNRSENFDFIRAVKCRIEEVTAIYTAIIIATITIMTYD